jgi:carboxylesterase type B
LVLQLNIPLSCLEDVAHSPKLPILVYIHGGGFILGQIDEQHNTALMVEQSITDSKPMISASIQYRLGALGYLHTPEVGAANLALNDQRNALLWIQRFVEGFGGDPKRVTAMGESAGAKMICSHMLSFPPASGPLFNRAILMSGIPGGHTTPSLPKEAETIYEKLLEKAGIDERGDAALKKLREMDVQKIVDATAACSNEGTMWLPVQDKDWYGDFAGSISWDKVPEMISQCEWIDEIVIGTTGFEVNAFRETFITVRSLRRLNRQRRSWTGLAKSPRGSSSKALQSSWGRKVLTWWPELTTSVRIWTSACSRHQLYNGLATSSSRVPLSAC